MSRPDERHRDVTPPPSERRSDGGLLAAVPGLLRIGTTAWIRTAEWGVSNSVRAYSRVLRAATSGEPPAELLADAGAEVRKYARTLLGIIDGDAAGVAEMNGDGSAETPEDERRPARERLREQGEELLRRSADLEFDEDAHPAYERILGELAPDEARILRLLRREGPHPAVDVRTGGPLGRMKSDLVAQGVNMIGAEAGCRYPKRVFSYLNNLNRLGLVWFSREQLDDLTRYQVLEVQPETTEAMQRAGRGARTVRRSIQLTAFGLDFCELCIPDTTAEFEAVAASVRKDAR
jgi:Abortive infection alpha